MENRNFTLWTCVSHPFLIEQKLLNIIISSVEWSSGNHWLDLDDVFKCQLGQRREGLHENSTKPPLWGQPAGFYPSLIMFTSRSKTQTLLAGCNVTTCLQIFNYKKRGMGEELCKVFLWTVTNQPSEVWTWQYYQTAAVDLDSQVCWDSTVLLLRRDEARTCFKNILKCSTAWAFISLPTPNKWRDFHRRKIGTLMPSNNQSNCYFPGFYRLRCSA